MRWREVRARKPLRLYAGDILDEHHDGWVGLSMERDDDRHVPHDVTWPMPLPDASVEVYQSEDVFEHVEIGRIPFILGEIHRVLESGGLLRWSMPDYRCDVLRARSRMDDEGEIVFDPAGGGRFENGRVVGGGHVWFPVWETVDELIQQSPFARVHWLHHYRPDDSGVVEEIDYTLGHIGRTPDHDDRVQDPRRPMSLVVDLRKDA